MTSFLPKEKYSIKWIKRFQPFGVISDKIFAYKKGRIYVFCDDERRMASRLDLSFMERIKESNRLFARLFRTDIRCSCFSLEKSFLFFKNKILFKFDLNTGKTNRLFRIQEGYSEPLNILESKDERYLAFWGDYFSNRAKKPVNIYGITTENKVEIVYTFPQGTIEHIHNIIYDGSNGFYIFTGDVVEKAGIYHASNGFKDVTPIFIGSHQARAVIGFNYKNGLLVATDSPSEDNILYHIYPSDGNKWVKTKLCKINGTCIYGTRYADKYIFSTVVEPPEPENNLTFFDYFLTKRANGVLSNDIDIIIVDASLNVSVIRQLKKDSLPMGFFQFGHIKFPACYNKQDFFCIYPVAARKFDGKMGIIKLN